MCDSPEVQPQRGWVGVVDNKIEMVSYDSSSAEMFMQRYPSVEEINCRGKVVMPGLINTHTHVSMTIMRNYADDKEINEWLRDYIWVFESYQCDDDIVAGSRLGIAEMLLGGTTTFVDMYMTCQNIAQPVKEMGIRAQLGECVIVEEGLDATMSNIDRALEIADGCSRLTIGVDPHAPYTCTPKMLDRAKAKSVECGLPISTHLLEGVHERELIFDRYGLNPLQYLDRHGILGERTILDHSIHLSSEDIDLIVERGCSVSHSPQSNMKLASGVAPVVEMMRQGVNVTLSTDGASSNNDLDMWEEMRTAVLLQRVTLRDSMAMSAYDALRMVTVNGAKAIGREGELGIVTEGALADLIVVDMCAPHMMPNGNIYSALLFCGKASDVEHVIVDGAICVRDRQLLNIQTKTPIDLTTLCKDVVRRKNRIIEQLSAE